MQLPHKKGVICVQGYLRVELELKGTDLFYAQSNKINDNHKKAKSFTVKHQHKK